jgi:tetratricopeptide (TPR) repeat protein
MSSHAEKAARKAIMRQKKQIKKFGSGLLHIALVALCCRAAAPGSRDTSPSQHQHEHGHAERRPKIGRVDFPISCSAAARTRFNRAVAWLHSFEYEEAERSFTEVAAVDPRCGMAYWGVAMSNYHPIWAPPTPSELKKGRVAIERAKSVGARTERERDYIAAIETCFRDSDEFDHRTRTLAYEKAMERVHLRYPTDHEATIFYALTLIASGMMANDKSYAKEKKAAGLLNRVLSAEPDHPGVAHYLIHSYDYPPLARLALPAARRYAQIAPASAHARHMPSHIFTRLGLWREVIRSNLDAAAAAKAYAARNHMAGAWDEQLHAMDYLVYAYLQGAQDERARRVLDELNAIERAEPENFKVAYAFTAIPARYALERRRWDEAAKLTLHPSLFPWNRFRWAEAHTHFARAVGAARSADVASARQEIEKLAAIRQALADSQADAVWARQVEIEQLEAAAWLAYAEEKNEEAIRLMRAAAELEDSTDKHPVTPGSILPAREMLGDLLLGLGQASQALSEFESSLRNAPRRFNGLYGAARAAADSGNWKKAVDYSARLLKVCDRSDRARPELEQVKDILKKARRSVFRP